MRLIVTRRLPSPVEATLRERYGATLNTDDHQFDGGELRDALAHHDIVLCTLTDRLPGDLLRAQPRRARLLANFGVGTNHIDLVAAREVGLPVTNTPGVLTEDTADLTMLLLLSAARRAAEGAKELRDGTWTGWRPTHLLGTRVSGQTLGVVGFGRIGQAVAHRAHHGFGMRIVYHSRRAAVDDVVRPLRAERCESLDALLLASDFVTLHCPATPETRHLIDSDRLARMRPTAFLVNTSRGDVVDERALIAALRTGIIAGAGLDVFEGEPQVPRELLELPNVFALPHLGSATIAARVAMGERVLANIAAFVAGGPLPDRVM